VAVDLVWWVMNRWRGSGCHAVGCRDRWRCRQVTENSADSIQPARAVRAASRRPVSFALDDNRRGVGPRRSTWPATLSVVLTSATIHVRIYPPRCWPSCERRQLNLAC
jgi:hypothetical protein